MSRATTSYPCSVGADKLIIITAGLAISTFVFSYTYSIAEKLISYPLFFLSSAINQRPASTVASLLLSPAMCILPCIGAVRHHQVQASKYDNPKVNTWVMIGTILCAIGGHGVASIPYGDYMNPHLFFAGQFFSFGCFVAIAQVFIDRSGKIETNIKACEKVRFYSTLLGAFLLCVMGGLGCYFSFFGELSDEILFFFALVEITFVFQIILVYLSMIPEFRNYSFKFCVVENERRSSEINNAI
ncbi:hypothetical protein ScalyP_jg10049 [Parmales sp. scaly parma]|nr:hypothetical protein ScalyP_jg10049 [Parmales sp. scaly parma]